MPAGDLDSGVARARVPFGFLAYAGAGISLAFCFAKAIVLTVLPALGLSIAAFDFNPHLQAVLMWLFVAVAVVGLSLDKRQCGSTLPLALGIVSFSIIVITLYGYYKTQILMMAYTMLIVAAFLNQSIRLKNLNREVESQARTVKALNATLEERVKGQVREIENLGRLKRFLAPAVAELLVSEGQDSRLDSHREYIATLFCDMRGFTSFTESMEPEEMMAVLRAFHEEMGRLAADRQATIDHRAGDGLMLFFNDPIPCDSPVLRAVQLALDMHGAFDRLNENWKKFGYALGFGIGIASGYATMGIVGSADRRDYTANGNAVNLAARLCDHAEDGQILISPRALVDVEDMVEAVPFKELQLKGINNPVVAYRVLGLKEQETDATIQSSPTACWA
jgi:class 3 adenylate cyclase